jgi:S-formylglutathione hydrolase FrmB
MKPLFLLLASFALTAQPLRFRITLDPSIAPAGASGRLLILLEKTDSPRDTIKFGFLPGAVWIAAKEIPHLAPGQSIELDPDELAFPKPFSQAPQAGYAVMALLDTDHSFARDRQGPGDLTSSVLRLPDLNPASAAPVSLTLSAVTPPKPALPDTEFVKSVELLSPSLSEFAGRPIHVRAAVVLPTGHSASSKPLPAVYHVHGFGGSRNEAWARAPRLVKAIDDGERFRAVHVYLDANCPGGHHVFADSLNNGPWGHALTTEFIPFLEKQFRLVPSPAARFLTGHSSGGWSTLWLQVSYPDFFGGTWPTAPDSVDFRSFTGIDATPESSQNAFLSPGGGILNLVRLNGKDALSFQEFARMEAVTGDYGGQLASFEWAFSPRGPDGRPLPLFNRVTGELYPGVRPYWQRYDIARILRDNWATLGPKLRGKVRLVVGDADNFHLNESAAFLCSWLAAKGREDACEIVPGRDHFDLFRPYKTYPKGLDQRIDDEMRAKWKR